ncbi:Cell division cycle protein 48, partial [Globisporangium splendens]
MAASLGAPSRSSSWRARAFAGDVHASLLLPHQMLVAHEDAQQYGVTALCLVEVAVATESSDSGTVVLECIVDRSGSRSERDGSSISHSRLERGSAQLSPWVLEFLQIPEASVVRLTKRRVPEPPVEVAHCTTSLITMSLCMKYPPAVNVSSTSASASSDTAHQGAIGDHFALSSSTSSLQWLPESVRAGNVNLANALTRQLRKIASSVTAKNAQQVPLLLQKLDVVPMQLLYETYVFRVEDIGTATSKAGEETSRLKVRVLGWDAAPRDDEEDEELTTRVAAMRLNKDDEERLTVQQQGTDSLETRLWRAGFAGYNAFVHDVLLNIALIVKDGTRSQGGDLMQQIASHGILLSGVHGVGKSLVLRVLEKEITHSHLRTRRIDGMSLLMESENTQLSSTFEFLLQHVQTAFPEFQPHDLDQRSAAAWVKGVLLIDDIDVLFQTAGGDASDVKETLAPLGSSLLRLLDAISDASRICIIGTTSNADVNIPTAAKRAGRFGKILEMIVPTEAMRADILARHLSALPVASDDQSHDGISRGMATRLAALTGGYVAKDLVRICRNALIQAHKRNRELPELLVRWEDLVGAQQLVKPSQLRELNVASPGSGEAAATDSGIAFAGYAALQKQLVDFISWKFSPTAAMNSSEVMSKYFGDSEKAVRQLFARARAASPCILFFDEFDAIAHKRSFSSGDGDGGGDGGGDSVYARILSTFLNEMDGIGAATSSKSTSSSGEILVIAATNRIDALDAALIRPGRIDKMIEIGFPTETDKEAILAHYTRKMPLDADVAISTLAARPTGYEPWNRPFTGADLAAVCKDAAFRALREDLEASAISVRHFEDAWSNRI